MQEQNEDLPEDILEKLRNLDLELEDGDITQKGYDKKKASLLASVPDFGPEPSAADVVDFLDFLPSPTHSPKKQEGAALMERHMRPQGSPTAQAYNRPPYRPNNDYYNQHMVMSNPMPNTMQHNLVPNNMPQHNFTPMQNVPNNMANNVPRPYMVRSNVGYGTPRPGYMAPRPYRPNTTRPIRPNMPNMPTQNMARPMYRPTPPPPYQNYGPPPGRSPEMQYGNVRPHMVNRTNASMTGRYPDNVYSDYGNH